MYRFLAACELILVAVLALTASTAASANGDRSLELPAWSPDGTRIAWGSAPFGSPGGASAAQIWTAAADGSGAEPLIGGLHDGLFQIVWPQPDTLLYDANYQVIRAGTSRSHKVILPDTGSSFATDTHGDRVASRCDQCNGPIVVVTVKTGKRVTIGGKDTSNGAPTLSPDGSRVAFDHAVYDKATGRYVADGLWVATANGTGRRRISRNGVCATWSAAGNAIAYLTPGRTHLGLRTITPDGSHSRLLVAKGPTCSVPPSLAWSPNGKQIAYIGSSWGRLVVVNVASGHAATIDTFKSVTGVAWSPDSTQLLVTARPDPTTCSSLWRIDADGSNPLRLATC